MLSILELIVVQKCNPALYFGSCCVYDPYLSSFRFGCMLRAGARFRFIVAHSVLQYLNKMLFLFKNYL